MIVSIRAVYENGTLRPLTPIELEEGQEVQIEIVPTEDPVYAALGDLVVIPAPGDLPDLDEDALQAEIDRAYQGIPPVSEAIMEERHEGP